MIWRVFIAGYHTFLCFEFGRSQSSEGWLPVETLASLSGGSAMKPDLVKMAWINSCTLQGEREDLEHHAVQKSRGLTKDVHLEKS